MGCASLKEVSLERGCACWSTFEPVDALAFLPNSVLDDSIWQYVLPFTVLLAVLPIPGILTPISPRINPISFLFIEHIFAIVHSPIRPTIDTSSMHIVVLPLALIPSPSRPTVSPFAAKHVLVPVPFI